MLHHPFGEGCHEIGGGDGLCCQVPIGDDERDASGEAPPGERPVDGAGGLARGRDEHLRQGGEGRGRERSVQRRVSSPRNEHEPLLVEPAADERRGQLALPEPRHGVDVSSREELGRRAPVHGADGEVQVGRGIAQLGQQARQEGEGQVGRHA